MLRDEADPDAWERAAREWRERVEKEERERLEVEERAAQAIVHLVESAVKGRMKDASGRSRQT